MLATFTCGMTVSADRTTFIHADSYRAADPEQQSGLDELLGAAAFLIANPPASRSGDGLRHQVD